MNAFQSAQSACRQVNDLLASYQSQENRRRFKRGVLAAYLADLERSLGQYVVELEAYTDQVCETADALAGTLGTEAIEPGKNDLADPDGTLRALLETTEADLRRHSSFDDLFRELAEAGIPDSHGAFVQYRRATELNAQAASALQEIRWHLMIHDGLLDAARSPNRRTFTSASEWMAAALHGE